MCKRWPLANLTSLPIQFKGKAGVFCKEQPAITLIRVSVTKCYMRQRTALAI